MTAIPSLCPLLQGMGSKGWHSSPEGEHFAQVGSCTAQQHKGAAMAVPMTQPAGALAIVQSVLYELADAGPLLEHTPGRASPVTLALALRHR